MIELFSKERGKFFLDVGAHAGRWTIPLAKIFDRVVAFEPNPYSCQALSENTLAMPNVSIWCMGVSDKPGIRVLTELKDTPSRSTVHPEFSSLPASRFFFSYFIKLDDYFKGASLLKVDTEGSEAEVLRGANKILSSGARFCVETHSERLYEDCMAVFDSLGIVPQTMTLDDEAPASLHAQHGQKHKYLVSRQ